MQKNFFQFEIMAPSNNPKSKVCKRKKDVMDQTQKLKILDLLRYVLRYESRVIR